MKKNAFENFNSSRIPSNNLSKITGSGSTAGGGTTAYNVNGSKCNYVWTWSSDYTNKVGTTTYKNQTFHSNCTPKNGIR